MAAQSASPSTKLTSKEAWERLEPILKASGFSMSYWQIRHPRNAARFRRAIAIERRAAQAKAQAQSSEEEFERKEGERLTHAQELERCAADVVYWMDRWCWTFDPRLLGKKRPSTASLLGTTTLTPATNDATDRMADPAEDEKEQSGAYVRFHPWPKQVEFLRWLEKLEADDEPGLLEKSRDQGASYLVMAFFLHRWLFRKGYKATLTSFESDAVDLLDDPDSLFEKLRIMLRRLPTWMLPEGFSWHHHDLFMRLVNPSNGSIITGEAGKDAGRSGRSRFYLVDEAAFLSAPQAIERALSGNTNCVLWASTVADTGMGNFFAQKRHSDSLRPDQIFRMHYSDDPRKNAAWVATKKASLTDPLAWELEYEINYAAAIEGIVIPAKWVQAAQRLYKMDPKVTGLKFGRKRIAGVDVGAGKAKSIYIDRAGPVLSKPQVRTNPDTTGTAHWALDLMRKRRAEILNYDAVGPGIGVTSTFADTDLVAGLQIYPINTGVPASSDREWPDGRLSEEIFINLRAEAWWLMRTRLQRTYEHVTWLEWQQAKKANPQLPQPEDAAEHPIMDLLAIPSGQDVAPLVAQLSLPKWRHNDRGKIAIEKKEDMAKRGIPSPDYADAAVMTMIEQPDAETHGIFKRPWFRLWPRGKKLPEFAYVVLSVRTAFDDERTIEDRRGNDYFHCGVYGVFNVAQQFKEAERKELGIKDQKYAAILCDYVQERYGFSEALEKVRELYRLKWGAGQNGGRKPDMVIVREGGTDDRSVRLALEEFKVPSWPFATEMSPTMEAQQAAVVVEQGGLFVPESDTPGFEGRFRNWAEPMVKAACSFAGKGSLTVQGGVDQLAAALLHLQYSEQLKVAPRRVAHPDPDEKTEADEREAVEQHRREQRGKESPYG